MVGGSFGNGGGFYWQWWGRSIGNGVINSANLLNSAIAV